MSLRKGGHTVVHCACFGVQKKEQLTHHVDYYQRHIDMASAQQITDSSLWLVESPNPYRMGDLDYVKLSQEESLKFYLERHSSKSAKGSPVDFNSALMKLTDGTLVADLN